MVVFAQSVYQAANTSACRARILRVHVRTPVPDNIQSHPYTVERNSVCWEGVYRHWKSCKDYCYNQQEQPLQRDSWNYVTSDVLVSMKNVLINPLENKHGLCGPVTHDRRCVLNAMHWDTRKACTLVLAQRLRTRSHALGVVSTVYAGAPGHFPQETVPSLLRLLQSIPSSVPLWLPATAIARRYASYLCDVLSLPKTRFVYLEPPIKVGLLYMYRPDPPYIGNPGARPLTVRSRDDFRLMRDVLRPNAAPYYRTLLLIRRFGARSLRNYQPVVAALNEVAATHGLKLDVRVPGHTELRDDALAFRAAQVVVGVHGAGMANMFFCSTDASIVEIGYTSGMPMPEIYFDQARFLNLSYWAVAGRGSYNGDVTVEVSRLAATVARAMVRHTKPL